MKRLLLLILIYTLLGHSATAQNNPQYLKYIETYKKMAIAQMERYHIPASITLAQGLLESAAGQSTLATKANNHFGIKVGGSWTGPYVVKSDDRPDDRFRKYKSASESYEDHSQFLLRPRYAALFQLDPTDYVGWAHGLKAAGYATNPKYAYLLIGVIENYKLYEYDTQKTKHQHQSHKTPAKQQHRALLCNDVVYIRALKDDSFKKIAKEFGIRERALRKYNEVGRSYELHEGDIVYLAKKKTRVAKAARGTYHYVDAGESMYSISQRYGIRLAKLYRWNHLSADYVPKEGDVLKLR